MLIVNDGTPAAADMGSQDTGFPSYDQSAMFNGFHFHAYIDLDNDGLKDLLAISDENENSHGMWFYKNVGTASVPLFEFREDNFLQNQMIEAGEVATPSVVDFDGDGLLDIVMGYNQYIGSTGGYKLSLRFYKNTGTPTNPAFELMNSDVSTISQFNYLAMIYPTFGDLDGDGDLDLLLGSGLHDYFESTRYKFNINVSGGDLNSDGKVDFVIGQSTGGLQMQYQTSSAISVPEIQAVLPSMEVFPNPSGDVFHIRLFNLGNESALLRLYNLTGV
ncbi:MAG: VCBS repeat-containing protein [Bacteroidetes bacterium]|nr:VCBS repeat-containing protein [Bacteroidota bacterium]